MMRMVSTTDGVGGQSVCLSLLSPTLMTVTNSGGIQVFKNSPQEQTGNHIGRK